MRVRVHRLHLLNRHGGINFRRDDRRMAEQLLNHAQIGAGVQHVRCCAVPECMGIDALHAGSLAPFPNRPRVNMSLFRTFIVP